MARRTLTTEQLDRMADMRERGLSYGRIALALGISQSSAQWHCLKLGVIPTEPCSRGRTEPACGRAYTPSEDALLLSLRLQGASLLTIAQRLGRGRSSVHTRLLTIARREAMQEAA